MPPKAYVAIQALERKSIIPQLMDAADSARFVGVSMRKFYELRAEGKLPPPVRLGERTVRHRRSDLIAFVNGLESAPCIPEPEQLARGRAAREGA